MASYNTGDDQQLRAHFIIFIQKTVYSVSINIYMDAMRQGTG
jgi:hypothetical protein